MRTSAILLALALLTGTTDSHACDCAGVSVAESADRAEAIHVVTAAGVEREASTRRVTARFQRLATLEGDANEDTLTWTEEGLSKCFPHLSEDTPGLFFVMPDGGVSICSNSGSLEGLARGGDLRSFIALAAEPVDTVEAFTAALEAAGFQGYLHGAEQIFVLHPELGGATAEFHGTELVFIHAIDGLVKHLIEVDVAAQRGPLTWLSLSYPVEGLVIDAALLETEARGLEVVHTSIAER